MFLTILLIAVPVLSLISATMYWWDKRNAQTDRRRIPETTLLLVDLAGGWPGGWWAQQRFRHKTRKLSYRLKFGAVVALNLAGWALLWRLSG